MTICQWSETRSYGEITYRVIKLDSGTVEVQQHVANNGWVVLESFSKGRLMAVILEKLGTLSAPLMTSNIVVD